MFAMLANYNPLSVLLSAFFIAYIKKGSDVMQSIASIPTQVSMIVQAILIILIASKLFLEGWRHRRSLRMLKENWQRRAIKWNS